MPNKTTANIKNALFVGSTNELQKMLNRKKEDEIIEGETGQLFEKDNSDEIKQKSNLVYIKSMTPLPELLNGEELTNPILSTKTRKLI